MIIVNNNSSSDMLSWNVLIEVLICQEFFMPSLLKLHICAFRAAVLSHLKTYNLYYEGQNLQLRHREVCISSLFLSSSFFWAEFSFLAAWVALPVRCSLVYPAYYSQHPRALIHMPCLLLALTGRGGAHLRGLVEYLLGPATTNQAADAGWPRAGPAATLLYILALRLQSGQSRVSCPEGSSSTSVPGNGKRQKVTEGRYRL